MKDALGNEIIIGNYYGYARSKSGTNIIKFGIVESVTPFGFALVKLKKSYISDNFDQPVKINIGKMTRFKVKPFMLFPITQQAV